MSIITAFPAILTPERQEEIRSRVVALHERSGITVADLAAVSGVSESTITRYFAGKTKDPQFCTLCAIILALGGDINEIISADSFDADPTQNQYREFVEMYQRDIAAKNESIKIMMRLVSRNHVETLAMLGVLLAVLAFVIGVFLYDLAHPDRGWFQHVAEYAGAFLWSV